MGHRRQVRHRGHRRRRLAAPDRSPARPTLRRPHQWRNRQRAGLRSPWAHARVGSTPTWCTIRGAPSPSPVPSADRCRRWVPTARRRCWSTSTPSTATSTTMAQRWPGRSLRPHVKAFKSTALAAAAGRGRARGVLLRHRPGGGGHGGRRAGRGPAAGQRGPRPRPPHPDRRRPAGPDHRGRRLRRDDRGGRRRRHPRGADRRRRRPAPLRVRPGRRRPPGRPGPGQRASRCAA